LLSILQSTVDTAGQIKDLVIEETPLVVQQLLTWHMAHAGFNACIGLFVILVAYLMIRCIYKAEPTPTESDRDNDKLDNWAWQWNRGRERFIFQEPAPYFVMIGGILLGLAGFIIFIANIPTMLQIWLAPKVYLIEYMAALSKGV
jgi:hypothetical protein